MHSRFRLWLTLMHNWLPILEHSLCISQAHQVQPQPLNAVVSMGFVQNQAIIIQNVHSHRGSGLSMPSSGTYFYIQQDLMTFDLHGAVQVFYHNIAVLVENGKFLLSAKRGRRTTSTEYIISMNTDNISRSNKTYVGN